MVSVIIPVYNGEKYVSRAIDSVLGQTNKDYEIIVIDDGSTDRTRNILEYYKNQYACVKVVIQDRGGVSAARNKGIDIAIGDYICFLDSDDWLHKDFLYFMEQAANTENADIISCARVVVNSLDSEVSIAEYNVKVLERIKEQLNDSQIKNSVCGKLYKKELISWHRFATGANRYEDVAFNIELLCSQRILVASLDMEMYSIYRHDESTTHRIFSEGHLISCMRLLDIYQNTNVTMKYAETFFQQICKSFLSCRYLSEIDGNRKVAQDVDVEIKKLITISEGYPCDRDWTIVRLCLKAKWLYRWLIELNDPSLRKWKKYMKARRRAL